MIAPSILASDFGILGEQLSQTAAAGVTMLHIDVMDGMFVPSISFGMPVIRSIRKHSKLFFDCHLMIEDPARYIDAFADCGVDGITVHEEACPDVPGTLQKIKARGLKAGLSIKPGTPVKVLEPYVSSLDMILIMTVEPGFGGQKFFDNSPERIRQTRALIDRLHPGCLLQVDGGINTDTIVTAARAGANVFVAGSAVYRGKNSIKENIRELSRMEQSALDTQG